MINVFIVILEYSGAITYVSELTTYLLTCNKIKIHHIFLGSVTCKEFCVKNRGRVTEIHIPPPIFTSGNVEKYTERTASLLNNYMIDKENIICHLNNYTQINFGIEMKKRYNAKLVYTLHFLPFFYSVFNAYPELTDEDLKTDEQDAIDLKNVDKFICVTEFAADIIKRDGIPSQKIVVINNGYGEDDCKNNNHSDQIQLANKQRLKKELGFNEKDQIILFVGRVETSKGIEQLIEAYNMLCEKYNNIRLIIIGSGEIEKALSYTKFPARICFTGKQDKESLYKYYCITDIGIIPSAFEQCSYVALEMMKNGIAMIVSDVAGLNELFRHEENALLIKMNKRKDGVLGLEIDKKCLFENIESLLINFELRQSIGQNAQNKWKNKYLRNTMGHRVVQLYNNIVGL